MVVKYVVVRFDPADPENQDRFVQLPGRLGYKTASETKEEAERLAMCYRTKFGEPNTRAVTIEFKLNVEAQPVAAF